MSYDFTAADIVAKVREKAAERPDNIYDPGNDKACDNVTGVCSDGSTGCLIGQALGELGVNWGEHGALKHDDAYGVLTLLKIPHSADELDWLLAVQGIQDSNETWEVAVEFADGDFPLGD